MKTNTKNINHHQHQFYRRIFNILNDSKIRLSLICFILTTLLFNGHLYGQVKDRFIGSAQIEIQYYGYDVLKNQYYFAEKKTYDRDIEGTISEPLISTDNIKETNPFNLIVGPLKRVEEEGDFFIFSGFLLTIPGRGNLLLQYWQFEADANNNISGKLINRHYNEATVINVIRSWDSFVQMYWQYPMDVNSIMNGKTTKDSIYLKIEGRCSEKPFDFSVVIKAGKITNGTNEPVVTSPYALYQNYPNPFSASTQISFELPRKSAVNISIYSLNGECITELLNGKMEAGKHTIPWKVENGQLPSGTYLIKMKTDDFTQVKKCHFIR